MDPRAPRRRSAILPGEARRANGSHAARAVPRAEGARRFQDPSRRVRLRAMTQHGGDLIADVLARHGATHLFTLCGGHISPILTGAQARGLRVIDVRDEANAVFAADAVARMTGAIGVAAVTAGPGVTNTVTAVKNAEMAQSPVIV